MTLEEAEIKRLQAEIVRLRAALTYEIETHNKTCDERDRLRAAAKKVCRFDWSANDPDAVAAVDELRATLERDQP